MPLASRPTKPGEKALRRELGRTRRRLVRIKSRHKNQQTAVRTQRQRDGLARTLEQFIVDAVESATGKDIR